MATTTNYGWTTPDDTALVKDGAAAIRSLGTAIDTTTYNNAQAAIAKTLIDAKGDLIVGSAADTAARLAVGTNDYVLTADSTATNGVKWAAVPSSGAYTLLSTTTLSGTSTTVSSISSAYKHLRIVILGMSHDGGGSPTEVYPRMRFNSDTGNNYSDVRYSANEDNGLQSQTIGATDFLRLYGTALNNTATTSQMVVDIFNYANTTVHKQTDTKSYMRTMGGGWNAASLHGVWLSTSAISSITFLLSTASFDNGTVYIYGVN
jgi:hypothetical protein